MLKNNNMNNINETRQKLDELFSIYNTEEVRGNFSFAAFYGYCEGVFTLKESLTLDIFTEAVKWGMEVGKNGFLGQK
jgi:hypothetical protein